MAVVRAGALPVVAAAPGALAQLEAESRKRKYLDMLEAQLRDAGLPAPNGEVLFHPDREWRLDYGWPEWKVAIEYQGGIFVGARRGEADEWKDRASHRSLAGILRDQWKANEAQVLGWIVLFANARSVKDGQVLLWAERALTARGWTGARGRAAAAWSGPEGEVRATEAGLRLKPRKRRLGRKAGSVAEVTVAGRPARSASECSGFVAVPLPPAALDVDLIRRRVMG